MSELYFLSINYDNFYQLFFSINRPQIILFEWADESMLIQRKSMDNHFWCSLLILILIRTANLLHRQYPCGWASNEDDSNWKYRVSIYYATSLDSGEFKCTTPKGHSNSIKVLIKGESLKAFRTFSRRCGLIIFIWWVVLTPYSMDSIQYGRLTHLSLLGTRSTHFPFPAFKFQLWNVLLEHRI